MNSLYIETREEYLAPYATRSCEAFWDTTPDCEQHTAIPQTPFEQDRRFVLQSDAFKRMAGKSQNLLFRNLADASSRLHHTLQVTETASRIAHGLRLNVDLTEAIALGHDVGHMPFSHNTQIAIDNVLVRGFAGERQSDKQPIIQSLDADDGQLREMMKQCFYVGVADYHIFAHQKQSFHVLTKIECPSPRLTVNTQLGLLHNYEPKRLGVFSEDVESKLVCFEMLAVELADLIAWTNNDVEDAISKGFISPKEVYDVPVGKTNRTVGQLLGTAYSERVSRFIEDIVAVNLNHQILEKNGPHRGQRIELSPVFYEALNTLKDIVLEQVLGSPMLSHRAQQVQLAVSKLMEVEITGSFSPTPDDNSPSSKLARYRDLCDRVWRMSDYDLLLHLRILDLREECEILQKSFEIEPLGAHL